MSQNVGTLISSSIRPNDTNDPIASAYGNEIKGGHHAYATLSERDVIIEPRREWGMLVTVYNDGGNNKTYQLKYAYFDTNIMNNTNWVVFSGSGSTSGTTEWVDSVISILNTPPVSPTNGDRYLVGVLPTGAWNGNGNKIAQWDSTLSVWIYTAPTGSMSVRVDNETNSIYKYDGISTWLKELVNQVRFISPVSVNGLSFTVTGLTPSFDNYSTEMILLSNFATASFGGTTSININGLGSVNIKKVSSGSLVNIESNDFMPGIIYTLVYDGTFFQSNIQEPPTPSVTIGAAEDGDYTDGLFIDFTPSTPIGVPIDRFNEIFKSLVPPTAPNLSDWSASGTTTTGKLTFNDINGISGENYVGGVNSVYGSVDIDQLWSTGTHKLGILSHTGSFATNITGVLNYQVPANTGVPTPAFVATSFGDGATGSLYMLVNGITVSSIDLSSTFSAVDTTLTGATSGLFVSAATASKFAGGDPFPVFMNRTGGWLLKNSNMQPNIIGARYPNSINIVQGYNNIVVKHVKTASTITLPKWEFILDDNESQTTNVTLIPNYTFDAVRYISGIKYFTDGGVTYQWSVSNLYRNTYYPNGNALTFTDLNSAGVGGSVVPILNTNSYILGLSNSGGTESTVVSGTKVFTIAASGVRRLNESLTLKMGAKRTVQSNFSGGTQSVDNLLIDNVSSSSTLLGFEDFNDETFRLKNTNGLFQYDLYSSVVSNIWDKTQSLISGNINHINGLQIYGGKMVYPSINFSSFGSIFTNDNFGSAQTNYTTATGNRVYIRYVQKLPITHSNFTIIINGTGISFVPVGSLTSNNATLEIKLPGLSSKETGWLDAYLDFPPSPTYLDGDGCRNQGVGAGRSLNTLWGLNIGTKTTANSNGYVLIRITVASGATGNISDMTFSFT